MLMLTAAIAYERCERGSKGVRLVSFCSVFTRPTLNRWILLSIFEVQTTVCSRYATAFRENRGGAGGAPVTILRAGVCSESCKERNRRRRVALQVTRPEKAKALRIERTLLNLYHAAAFEAKEGRSLQLTMLLLRNDIRVGFCRNELQSLFYPQKAKSWMAKH
jgi:hypothetical protein